ncbi:UDP-N-acetyl-D-mannosamine dehydrogenase [Bacillus sp. DX1.1]|uniref:UDP-N-acetyl-D-mannosamine dehydrogenase n=1 Tax=unclassified Bacillus (in: firmicutes) TaxID=185979 RepID=UPI00257122A8|nr:MULTISPECIES: UDP-N-acetyl-D-mannosamine dehydrogenase [unclassified Bacillus (in: firmicutes)]MDM5154205.1 UDP-N-acetyl-D-mannosamine dehydrogenase [Bacillus sp. DX1.1]WJE83126.1 UDP-N-acetyl-D-mannosamine dehydrogenase [Bacillus sp. DX3.1]
MNEMKTCVVGLGYIGLPIASLLASQGYQVHGVDIDEEVVRTIRNGDTHIIERDLDCIVKEAVQNGTLTVSTKPIQADVFIISVPTPITKYYEPDVSYVKNAVDSIIPVLKEGDLVIIESTCPVGTTEMVADVIEQKRLDITVQGSNKGNEKSRIYVAYCPERVLPGHILQELKMNDRVVGGMNEDSTRKAKDFYKGFVKGNLLETNARTAEMVKLTENSFRDVNIAFANELSIICDQLQIDVWELISLANHHPRVNILQPGPGVGGHCIAVDPWFIVNSAPEQSKLIYTARIVNDNKMYHVVQKIREQAVKFSTPTIACFGLSFKANIDDLRESPAMKIVEQLIEFEDKEELLVVEPYISTLPSNLQTGGIRLTSIDEALEKAEIIVFLVDHDKFKSINQKLLINKTVIDTRGMIKYSARKQHLTQMEYNS